MTNTTINQRTIGVNFDAQGAATILVWAPLAKQITLAIKSTNEKLPLQKEAYGYWKLHTDRVKEGDLYKFIIDEEKEYPDPASLSQPEGVHGASAAVDLKPFAWTDDDWKNISLQDFILYELHTGTFTPEGTFEAIEEKLDHLVDLGINAIEIMPVAQFPGSRNWGYDGVFPFAVQHSYGGHEGLKKLVNRCWIWCTIIWGRKEITSVPTGRTLRRNTRRLGAALLISMMHGAMAYAVFLLKMP
jgi:maltooligosyltrehalose trehalohydrolase